MAALLDLTSVCIILSTPEIMASPKTELCIYFAKGICRNGDFCGFIHDTNTSGQDRSGPVPSALPPMARLNIAPGAAPHREVDRSTQVCTFFMRGVCREGDKCGYAHPPTIPPPQSFPPDTTFREPCLASANDGSPRTPSDTRARVPCKFFLRPGGCRNDPCDFLHTRDGHEAEQRKPLEGDADADEVSR
jgi:hypothetical protein